MLVGLRADDQGCQLSKWGRGGFPWKCQRGSLVESWVQKLLVDGRQEQSWSEEGGHGVKREGSHFAMADSGA